MNYLTTLVGLCMDDNTAQTTQKVCSKDTGQKGHKCSKTPQDQKGNKPQLSQVMNAGSQADRKNKSTWEASTLTGVSREQREDKKQHAKIINVLSSQHGLRRCGSGD